MEKVAEPQERRYIFGHIVMIGVPGQQARVVLCRYCHRVITEYSEPTDDSFVHDTDGRALILHCPRPRSHEKELA